MKRIFIFSIVLTINFFLGFSQKLPSDNMKKNDLLYIQHTVNDFYRGYTASILSDSHSSGLDMEKYLTKRLIEKIARIRNVTGADPIIRAQDFNETAFKTLKVDSLGDNWYMVNYKWNMNDDGSTTNIPLKVVLLDGRYMIDYITPEWNGSLYGDTVLCEDISQRTINNSTPRLLMETFYNAYTTLYGNMPEGLTSQLKALRNAYLTPNALNQFVMGIKKHESDGLLNYDLLIDNFDFDCLWIPSINFLPLTENSFQISYKQGEFVRTIVITLIADDGKYKIDDIRIKKDLRITNNSIASQ